MDIDGYRWQTIMSTPDATLSQMCCSPIKGVRWYTGLWGFGALSS